MDTNNKTNEFIPTKNVRGEDFTLKDYHRVVLNDNVFPSTRELFIFLDAKRREKQLRITEVISALGYSRTSYYRNLKGFKSQKSLPSYSTCYKYAQILGYTIFLSSIIDPSND